MAATSFGPFIFDHAQPSLVRDGLPLPINRRGAAVLAALLDAGGGVVSRNSLIEAGWSDVVVGDANLTVQVGVLRRMLGAQPDGTPWIVTMPRIGYRLGLPRVSSGAKTEPTRPTVGVLSFASLGMSLEHASLAQGITEELITALSRFKTLAVVGRNFTQRGDNEDPRRTAEALGVRYVIDGSVQRWGDRIRVTVQLIEGATGTRLWADRFDGNAGDILDFQDKATEAVIGLVEPHIVSAEIERARRKRPEHLDAYDLYLQALPLVASVDIGQCTRAVEILERAIGIDPTFAPLLALCAWAHERRVSYRAGTPVGFDEDAAVLSLAHRALEADHSDAMVLAIAGWCIMFLDAQHARGLALGRRAAELNPNNLLVLNFAGLANLHAGDLDEALALHSRALALNPDGFHAQWGMSGIALAHLYSGRYEQAAEFCRRSLDRYGEWISTYDLLVIAYGLLGQHEKAYAAHEALLRIRPSGRRSISNAKRASPFAERTAVWSDGPARVGLPPV